MPPLNQGFKKAPGGVPRGNEPCLNQVPNQIIRENWTGRGNFKELLLTRENFSEENAIEAVEELSKEVTEKEDHKAVKVVEIQHNQV